MIAVENCFDVEKALFLHSIVALRADNSGAPSAKLIGSYPPDEFHFSAYISLDLLPY